MPEKPAKKINLLQKVFLLTLLILVSSFNTAKALWFDYSWNYRQKITIENSQVNGDLTQFPVYLDLSDLSDEFFDNVESSGADIRVTRTNGFTEVPVEVVAIDATANTGELWFQAPSLSASTNGDFYIYYGNSSASAPAASSTYGSENVWSNGYVAVWHMNEDPSGSVINSVTNANHTSPVGDMDTVDLVAGQLGNAINFDGSNDYLDAGNGSLKTITSNLTMSAWEQGTTGASSYSIMGWMGNHGDRGTAMGPASTTQFAFNTPDGSGAWDRVWADDNITTEWQYISCVYIPSTSISIYRNGSFANGSTTSIPSSLYVGNSVSFKIGNRGAPALYSFEGLIDEARVSNVSRSSQWIATEYNNQNSASTFYTISAQETLPVDDYVNGWSASHKITILASEINGDLTNFPVYVSLADLPSSFFSTVNGQGADIRMTNGNQMTQLAFELVAIDTANGEGELWFKADFISSSTDTDFYLHYGNGDAAAYSETDPYGAQSVWTEGYHAVYHLGENGNTATDGYKDSSANERHGNGVNMATEADTTGKLGYSQEFNFGVVDYINLGTQFAGNGDFSISIWFTRNDDSTGYEGLLGSGNPYNGTGNYGYILRTWDASSRIDLLIRNGSSSSPGLYKSGFTPDTYWHQAYITLDRDGDARSYIDSGNPTTNSSATGAGSLGTANLRIGRYGASTYNYSGLIDEVRFSSVVRDTDWISAEYSNQNAPGNFYMIDNADSAGFDYSLWSNSHKITIPASEINGDLSNFPLYVNLADLPSSFFSTVNGQGADIRVTNGNQMTQLPFELVAIDTANATGELWFKADTISSSTDTDFYIWYGHADAQAYDRNDEFGSENVWTEGYLGVWHMNEDPTGTIYDSTSYRHDGSSSGSMTSDDSVSSKLGSGLEFDGSNDEILVRESGEIPPNLNPLSSDYVLSIWSKHPSFTGSGGDWDAILAAGVAVDSSRQGLMLRSGQQQDRMAFFGDTNTETDNALSPTFSLETNTWHYHVGMYDGTDISLYLDGAFSDSDTLTGTVDVAANTLDDDFMIGSAYNNYSLATLDEARASNIIRSADWISTEYKNQNSPGNFYQVDNADSAGFDSSLWSNSHKITIPASEINGDLSEFPLYVNLSDLPSTFFSTVNGQGADIRVTNGNQMTQLPFELVAIDTANATGELWFKADTISASTDTDFYVWYGHADAQPYDDNDEFGAQNVWTEGYVAVYHLNEDGNTTAGGYKDSTANNYDATGVSMTTSSDGTGKLGQSQTFDGSADYIELNQAVVSSFPYTLSAWGLKEVSGLAQTIVNLADSSSGSQQSAIAFRVDSGNEVAALWHYNSTYLDAVSSSPYLSTNQWYSIHGVFEDTSNKRLYLDGNYESNLGSQSVTSIDTLTIGRTGDATPTGPLDGSIDEVRVANTVRSADWITTEYKNQNSPGNFYQVDNADYAGFDSSLWSNSHKITIPASEINGDLTEFPLYVNLSDLPSSFFSTVNGQGADIRVTNGNQMTQLPFELVSIDTANATGELWFKADTISASTDTDFYIWYGHADAQPYDDNDEFGAQNVWTEGFVAVYHMNEDPTGTIYDSTSYNNDGTSAGTMTSDDLVSSKLGKAIDFDGSNDYIVVPNDASLQLTEDLTLDIWMKPGSTISAPAYHHPLINKQHTDSANEDSYFFVINDTTGREHLGSYGGNLQSTTDLFTEGTWHKMTSTYRYNSGSEEGELYIDAVLETPTVSTLESMSATTNELWIGGATSATSKFEGHLEEVRISNVSRSADWISTEYKNQNSPGNFYQVDNADYAGFDSSLWSNSYRLTVKAANLNGDLSNFPVYVDLADLPAAFFSTVNGQGADIRITNGNQMTQVPFELVDIDTSANTGELWFKADSISASTDTHFYVWFGHTDAQPYDDNDEFGAENVWTEGYTGVYHLSEDPTGAITNSVGNADATGTSMSPSDLKSDGILNDYYDLTTANDGLALNITATFPSTLSAWINWNSSLTSSTLFKDSSALQGALLVSNRYINYLSSSNFHYGASSQAVGSDDLNKWTHVNFTIPNGNASDSELYKDGTNISANSVHTGSQINFQNILFGYGYGTDFDGLVDEIRVSSGVRGTDWISSEYINQYGSTNFYRVDNGDYGDFKSRLWSNSHKITIPATQINGDLTNFPVYLDLADLPTSFFADVKTDGGDIRVTNGGQLIEMPIELVDIDTANGTGELWFRADSLSASTDTDFYIWYNNPHAHLYDDDGDYGAQNVWTQGYVAVYHLNEDGNTTAGGYEDSTANDNDGTGVSMTTSSDVTGKLGKAQTFDGAADHINISDSAGLIGGPIDATISLWIKDADGGYIYSEANPGLTQPVIGIADSSNTVRAFIRNNASTANNAVASTNTSDGNWHFVAATINSSGNNNIYVNAVNEATGSTTVTGATTITNTRIGMLDYLSTNNYASGDFDELHVSNTIRSDDWISTEYKNQNQPQGFYFIDDEFPGAAWYDTDWDYRVKITVDANQVNGDLTDFPVYLDLSTLSAGFFTNVAAQGRDLRVTQGDGLTAVAIDPVFIDTANAEGELWFKAPSLSASADTEFYLYYGNANGVELNADHPLGRHSVWSNGYVAVFHMDEDPSIGVPQIVDSTEFRNHGTTSGSMTSGDLVQNGGLGYSLDFDDTDDAIVTNNDYGMFGIDDFTVSAWVYPYGTAGNNNAIISKGQTSADDWMLYISNNAVRFYANAGSINATDSNPISTYTWSYAAAVGEGARASLYVNGNLASSDSTASASINGATHAVTIGASNDGSARVFDGLINEVHIANKARSAAWVKTEYNNQVSPSTFFTTSAVESISDIWFPEIISLDPENRAQRVSLVTRLIITFSEAVTTDTGNIDIYQENGNIFESIAVGSVTGSGTDTIIVDPATDFSSDSIYYVLIDPTAFKNSNDYYFPGTRKENTWRFSTQNGNSANFLYD